jgi:hypothetical protein
MCNMYQPLFSMIFLDLGLDNKISGRCDNCNSSYFKSSVKGCVFFTRMSGMRHKEEYLSIEEYIVKGEGFLPFSFLCRCSFVYSFLESKIYTLLHCRCLLLQSTLEVKASVDRSSITF